MFLFGGYDGCNFFFFMVLDKSLFMLEVRACIMLFGEIGFFVDVFLYGDIIWYLFRDIGLFIF